MDFNQRKTVAEINETNTVADNRSKPTE